MDIALPVDCGNAKKKIDCSFSQHLSSSMRIFSGKAVWSGMHIMYSFPCEVFCALTHRRHVTTTYWEHNMAVTTSLPSWWAACLSRWCSWIMRNRMYRLFQRRSAFWSTSTIGGTWIGLGHHGFPRWSKRGRKYRIVLSSFSRWTVCFSVPVYSCNPIFAQY